MKTICFDLDGVICNNTWGNYKDAVPFQDAIDKVNRLFDDGNIIIIFTARYMTKFKGDVDQVQKKGYKFTLNQLTKWNLKFHKLIMGKPSYDIIVDDKHFFYNKDWITNL